MFLFIILCGVYYFGNFAYWGCSNFGIYTFVLFLIGFLAGFVYIGIIFTDSIYYGIEFVNSHKASNLQVRHRLKKGYGIEGGIPVVFSLEKPKAKLLPFKGPNGEENPSDYQVG